MGYKEFFEAYDELDLSEMNDEELQTIQNIGNNLMLEVDDERLRRKFDKKKFDSEYLDSKIKQATPKLNDGELQEILNIKD